MRAAEAYWQGREELFSEKLDKLSPACFDMSEFFSKAKVKDPGSRDGSGWRAADLKKWDPLSVQFRLWKAVMEPQIVATEATRLSEEAITKLRDTVDKFRGAIKNDMTSMKAASDRVQSEVAQMQAKYVAAQTILISPEFQLAVSNAERLATALESIHKLQGQRIGFALFSGEQT